MKGMLSMIIRQKDETLEHMLKRFKRQLEKDGFYSELRKREYFVSKCERRRAKRQAAIKAEKARLRNDRRNDCD